MPLRPPLPSTWIKRAIQSDIVPLFEIVELTTADYVEVIERNTQLGLRGAVVYDSLHIHAARKSNADLIVTLNTKHFHRVAPEIADKIIEP